MADNGDQGNYDYGVTRGRYVQPDGWGKGATFTVITSVIRA